MVLLSIEYKFYRVYLLPGTFEDIYYILLILKKQQISEEKQIFIQVNNKKNKKQYENILPFKSYCKIRRELS